MLLTDAGGRRRYVHASAQLRQLSTAAVLRELEVLTLILTPMLTAAPADHRGRAA